MDDKEDARLSGELNEEQDRPPPSHSSPSRRLWLRVLIVVLLFVAAWLIGLHPAIPSLFSRPPQASDTWEESDSYDQPVGTLRWFRCPNPAQPGTWGECGFLIVPTDYANLSMGTTKVALGRKRATKEPRKGTVIFGAGGPGGAGAMVVRMNGESMQRSVTGEQWDIVGIDPRGIGSTEPATQCLPPGQNNALKANTVLQRNFDYSSSVPEPQLRASLLRQQEEMDALVKTQYAMCGVSMGKQVAYMGTTNVVRDIERVVSAIEGEGADINFYGGSYGSIIGQYLVNMFPDRVGKVMVEGIVDAVAWAGQPMYKSYRQWLSSTEDAYDWFVDECAKAGPDACALAETDKDDPAHIRERLEKLFDELYDRPLSVANRKYWGIVTSGMARTLLFRALQLPTIWPTMAIAFSQALKGDVSLILALDAIFSGYRDLERQAVSCNDAPKPPLYDPPTNEEIVDEIMGVARTVSKFAFSILTAEPDAQCHYWPVDPPERFTGPWNHTLKNPILVQSNTADPVTPIASANQLKSLLGESAVLVLQHAPGHGTTSFPTMCTINKTRAYFSDDVLPEDGHTCELESPLFPRTGEDRFGSFGLEERRMLEAAERVGIMMRGVDLAALDAFSPKLGDVYG